MNLWMSSEWRGSQAFGHDMRTARHNVNAIQVHKKYPKNKFFRVSNRLEPVFMS